MHPDHFESLLRVLAITPSRRSIARVLTGFALAQGVGSGWSQVGQGKGKKGKKGKGKHKRCPASCPVCQVYVNHRSCTLAANGAACENNPCKECQSGTCVDKPGNTVCNTTGRCLHGTCNQPPGCLSHFGECTLGGTPCCAGACNSTNLECDFFGAPGVNCNVNGDCLSHNCVGFRCQ